MNRTPSVVVRRGVALACCLTAFVFLSPGTAGAGLIGSLHDFAAGPHPTGSAEFRSGGSCWPCHRAHAAQATRLWSRSLSEESTAYKQTSNPNYLPGATLQCYDCHDNAVFADADPPVAVWAIGRGPQDIALDGTAVGFYEMICGQLPDGNSPPTSGAPTGGHYWKSEPGLRPDYQRGDKIPCSLCHDPHDSLTGTNEVFFRTTTWDGSAMKPLNDFNSYGTDLKASANTREGTGDGRAMCAICHGYSNEGNQALLFNVTVPKPPGLQPGDPVRVFEHESGNATPCTDCHGHNKIAGCNECHGYPPLVATDFNRITNPNGQSYPDGAGAHQRHLLALGQAIFNCAICHGPDPGRPTTVWHNENPANCGVVVQANVDIRGQIAYWGAGSSYNGVTSGGDASYAFAAKGGGDQRCAGLTCHGGPPDTPGALNWTDRMVDDATGNPVADAGPNAGDQAPGDSIRICKWCHDATPAKIGTGPYAPDVLGDNDGATGVWTTGTWGADVNGHGKPAGNYDADAVGEATPAGVPAANKQCTVCHDATYGASGPTKAHFDGLNAENRLRGTINGLPAPNDDAVCINCHQNAGGTVDPRSQVSTHGNNGFSGRYHAEYSRQCRQCHEVHGSNWNGTGRNLHMVGKWLDENGNGTADAAEGARIDSNATTAVTDITTGDIKVNLTSNTGENSYDDGWNDNQHDSVCAACHKSANMRPTHTTSVPPYHDNSVESQALQNTGHNIGKDCTQCHKHESDKVAATADAWMPTGCNGCHGTNDTEPLANDPNAGGVAALRGQFWPDGSPVLAEYAYADDQTGAHRRHVESMALQLYGETAAVLVTDTGNGSSAEKQKTICAFCHPDPGGGGHSANDSSAPSGSSRVDVSGGTGADLDPGAGVLLDWLRKYTPNAGPVPVTSRATYADDTTATPPNGYSYTDAKCSNLVCHNQAATPSGGANWNSPPDWAAGALTADPACSNTTCHATGTYTNMHAAHVETAQKSYACTECHRDNYTVAPANPIPLGHGNGEVDMVWNNAGSIEGTRGGGDGFYDKNAPGDTEFAYKNGNYAVTCNLVYCHGGDNPGWGGGDPTPVWNDATTVYCGSCHDGNGTGPLPAGDASVVASGNHTDHLTAAYGPVFTNAGCTGTLTTGCHTAFDVPTITATHVDGTVEFANLAGTPFSPLGTLAVAAGDATDTDRCSHCHSTASFTFNVAGPGTVTGAGAALAKTNWANGTYALPCLSCHNGADPGTNYADGTGRAAPNMMGDDTNYGAEIRGHNRSVLDGPYPVSANNPAARLCTDCHDAGVTHLNNVDDVTYVGNRMLLTINSKVSSTRTMACESCHSTAGSSPATKKNVNTHGNNNGTYLEPAAFQVTDCMQCHEPHGMTLNGGGGYNIQMIAPAVTVVAGTTVGVRFESLAEPGTNTFNDNDTPYTPGDDICVVCHMNSNNPGYSMDYDPDGKHSLTPDYNNDERGTDCTNCHSHNKDNTLATPDGFMPQECNACHEYPGKPTLAGTHLLSPAHYKHVTTYGFPCSTCHYQSRHNEAGVTGVVAPTDWATRIPSDAVLGTVVEVRFDNRPWPTGWNPGTTLPPLRTSDSPDYDDTNNICSNLYCHGDDTARFPAADQGGDTTPDWDLPETAACGTCHLVGPGAVAPNPTTPPGTPRHPKHAGSAAGQYRITCQTCHYGTTQTGNSIANYGLHVNKAADVSLSALADPRAGGGVYNNGGDNGIGAPYYSCSGTYCHSPGTLRASPFTDPPAQSLVWDQSGSCWSCHGDGAASAMPDYADGTPKANKHDKHVVENGYGCQVCHWPTTQTGNSIVSTTLHVNQAYDADDDDAGSTLDAFTYAAGSCTAAACHGGHTSGALVPAWTTPSPIDCNNCHGYVAGVAAAADVNNFAWDGVTQSKIAAGEFTAVGHGGKSVACTGCHSSAVPHDRTMAGTNLYRFDAAFSCATVNSSCHASGTVGPRTGLDISTFVTHSAAQMGFKGYGAKRNWPAWEPQCVNCHDPHGDGANLSMLQRELYDKAAFNLDAAAPADPTEQTNLLFTDDTTGVGAGSYAEGSSPFSGICQECHEDASMISFHDGPTGGTAFGASHPAVGSTDCSACHRHNGAFAPMGCESCHDYDGPGPNVMGPGTNFAGVGSTPKPYDDGAWGFNVNGHGANGTAPFTPKQQIDPGPPPVYSPTLTPDRACTDCHDTSLPPSGDGRHLNGILNSVDLKLNPSENTAHLRTDTTCPPGITGTCYPFIDNAGAGGEANVQVDFDRACWINCHSKITSFPNMRHVSDLVPAWNNLNIFPNAARFGDKGTVADGESIALPIDSALTTLAGAGGDDFAPCISCHNPHGTPISEPARNTNRMVRQNWVDAPNPLCKVCHQ